MLPYLRLEIVRNLRNRRFLFFVIAFPVLFYLLFTKVLNVGGSNPSDQADVARIYMISMAAYGALGSTLMQTGPRIALERALGWNQQLRLTPLRGSSALAAKVLAGMLLALPVIVLITLIGRVVNDVTLAPGPWIATIALLWAFSAPFAALGVCIGYLVDSETAQIASMISYFLLAIVGGLWTPVQLFPSWLRNVAEVLPSYHYGNLGWSIVDGKSVDWVDLVVLVGYAAVFAAIGAFAYRRASRTSLGA